MGMFDLYEGNRKRTLGIRDKQLLYIRSKKKCEACEKKIDFTEMEVGHKKAHAKGGTTSLKNLVCLCPTCNKLQGTDSWDKFLKKLGKAPKEEKGVVKKRVKVGETIWGDPIYRTKTVKSAKKKKSKIKKKKRRSSGGILDFRF